MIRAYAQQWAGILGTLTSQAAKISKLDDDEHIDELLKKELDTWLKLALRESELLRLHSGVMKAIHRAQDILKKEKAAAIADELKIAGQVMFDALDGIMFLHIPSGNIKYYNEKQLFGIEVEHKFPQEVLDDIQEAGKCFALNRYTACIFHLMRVMESAVQHLGRKIKVKLKKKIIDETWHNILKAVNIAIGALPEATQKQKDKKDRYELTYIHLNGVRIVWRNKTMHPKVTYTEEEARAIWGAVEIFLKDLVKIL